MNREQLTQRALYLRALKNLVVSEEAIARREMEEAFTMVGQREVAEVNGQSLGSVQKIKGTSTWQVVDHDAWLKWCEKHAPDEIVTTKSVRSSYTDAVIAKLKANEPDVDEETGEVICPDGIIPKSSPPSIRVSASKEAPQIVLQAMGDAAVLLRLAEPAELLS